MTFQNFWQLMADITSPAIRGRAIWFLKIWTSTSSCMRSKLCTRSCLRIISLPSLSCHSGLFLIGETHTHTCTCTHTHTHTHTHTRARACTQTYTRHTHHKISKILWTGPSRLFLIGDTYVCLYYDIATFLLQGNSRAISAQKGQVQWRQRTHGPWR